MSAPTAVNLFSGLDGFGEGATQAGVDVLWGGNHWDSAIEWGKRNHPNTEFHQQDLMEADWTLLPDADYVLASPACQGHSHCSQPARKGTGGSHRPDPVKLRAKGQRDRNTAYAVLGAADTLRPRSIVVENTVDFQKWEAFEAWCAVLEAFGYTTRVQTLNGLHYGGAQDRPRTIVTASQAGAIELAPRLDVEPGTIGACLDADDFAGNRWSDVSSKSERMVWRIRKAQNEAGSRCFWNNVSESRGRAMDEPFPTATTKSGSQWCLIDGDRIRILNPREIARSMSFPESYQLPRARGLAGKLVGNAIDVRFARGIVSQVMAA